MVRYIEVMAGQIMGILTRTDPGYYNIWVGKCPSWLMVKHLRMAKKLHC